MYLKKYTTVFCFNYLCIFEIINCKRSVPLFSRYYVDIPSQNFTLKAVYAIHYAYYKRNMFSVLYHNDFIQFTWNNSISFPRNNVESEIEKSPSLPSTYTDALNQSNAVSCHFDFPFPEQVNFRLRAIFLILTLIIGKEDIAVGILGLNGKEDWSWDSTDEMNFQWRLRSKIQNEGARGRARRRETERERDREGEKEPFPLLRCYYSTPCSFFLSWCSTFSLVPHCYCSCTSFGNCWYFLRNLGRKHKTRRMRQGVRVSRKERTEITLLHGF